MAVARVQHLLPGHELCEKRCSDARREGCSVFKCVRSDGSQSRNLPIRSQSTEGSRCERGSKLTWVKGQRMRRDLGLVRELLLKLEPLSTHSYQRSGAATSVPDRFGTGVSAPTSSSSEGARRSLPQ